MQTRVGLLVVGLLLVVIAAYALWPQEEPALPEQPPPVRLTSEAFTLENGLAAELVSGPCGDTVGVAVLYAVGSDHDPSGRSGLSRVIARLLAGDERDGRDVIAGASYTLVSEDAPRARLAQTLEDAAARLQHLEIDPAAFEEARTAVLADVAARHGGDPSATASAYALESVRPTPDGFVGGVAEELASLDAAEVQAFADAHLTPGNARLVVVGDLAETAHGEVERAFANISRGTPADARTFAPASVSGTIVMGDAPSALAIAVPPPAATDPLYPAFLVLATRLEAEDPPHVWEASYDPVSEPDALFVTDALDAGETPDTAAARLRGQVNELLSAPLTASDVEATHARFERLLPIASIEVATCAADPASLARARARVGQLALDSAALEASLAETTQAQLEQATLLFAANRSAAVVGGGAIR